jgi:hypothetical protein
MSIEERDDLNPEEDPGMRRESEDVEGHASHTRDAATRQNADDEEGDDDVEAHSSKNR